MHTVLSAFADSAAAQRAVDRLAQAGFGRDDMHVQHREVHVDAALRPADWEGMEREVAVDHRVLESIGNFFAGLIGRDHAAGRVDTYSQAVARGEFVVVVDADDEVQAQRAAAVLDECGGRDRSIVPRSRDRRPLREMKGRQVEV